MHPLVWLVWRDTRSAAQGVLRRVRRPRGALAAAGLFFVAALAATTAARSGPRFAGDVAVYGPPGLLLLVMLGAFSPSGLYFRPPDVHWLLGAPLSRTALVLYNVAVRARTAIFSGLLLALLPSWRPGGFWAALAGYTLVFLLLQTSAQWMAVVRAWLAQRVGAAWRRALGVAVFGVPLLALGWELRARRDLGLGAFFAESAVLDALVAPVRPFATTVTAAEPGVFAANAALSFVLLAAAIAHICWLDVAYREAAVAQSERRERRFARMRRGGGAFGAAPTRATRRLPMLPALGGAGPVAWRQLQELARNPHGIALLLSVIGLVAAACIGLPRLRGGDPELVVRMGRTGIFLVAFLPLLMGDNIACDFRRDLDRMAQLKSWPIRPLALAAGQIAPAVLFATAVQLAGIGLILAATGALPVGPALLVMAIMPVVSWVALCLDNALFLWMPYRTVPEDPGDVGFVGRTLATALFKFTALWLVLGAALLLAFLALEATGSPWLAVGVSVVTLLGACAVGTVAVARGFTRFDLAADAPV